MYPRIPRELVTDPLEQGIRDTHFGNHWYGVYYNTTDVNNFCSTLVNVISHSIDCIVSTQILRTYSLYAFVPRIVV